MTETNQPKDDFPLYKMMVDGAEHWLPIEQAGISYDTGLVPVEIGGLALDNVGTTRKITDEERNQISEIADEYSASK